MKIVKKLTVFLMLLCFALCPGLAQAQTTGSPANPGGHRGPTTPGHPRGPTTPGDPPRGPTTPGNPIRPTDPTGNPIRPKDPTGNPGPNAGGSGGALGGCKFGKPCEVKDWFESNPTQMKALQALAMGIELRGIKGTKLL